MLVQKGQQGFGGRRRRSRLLLLLQLLLLLLLLSMLKEKMSLMLLSLPVHDGVCRGGVSALAVSYLYLSI